MIANNIIGGERKKVKVVLQDGMKDCGICCLLSIIRFYGGEVSKEYLREATPKDTGLTADSWYYEIEHDADGATIIWKNSNFQNGIQIALLLQYGHATRNGGWVEGIDYINPALKPVFDKMAMDAQKEVNGIL